MCWSVVCNEEQTDAALDTFMNLFIPVTNKHKPIKKMTVKTVKSPWIYEEFKKWYGWGGWGKEEWQISLAAQPIDKSIANCEMMWLNWVQKKKELHYETKINDIKYDSKNTTIQCYKVNKLTPNIPHAYREGH